MDRTPRERAWRRERIDRLSLQQARSEAELYEPIEDSKRTLRKARERIRRAGTDRS